MKRVWIDTDLALGAGRGDVDDGWAIAAIACGGAEILGVSTVSGNAPSATAARCSRDLLARLGVRADVVEGAARPGAITAAVEALAGVPAGTDVLAIGPLTNVAAALARDPSLSARITVHFVGGNLTSRGRWPPVWPHEFNLAIDPAAADLVLRAPVRRRLHPLDECCRLTVSGLDLLRIARGSAIGAYLAARSLRWWMLSPLRLRALRFPVWDLAPALDVLGLLPARVEERRLGLRGRGLLVRDEAARITEVVRGIDRGAALGAFEGILGG